MYQNFLHWPIIKFNQALMIVALIVFCQFKTLDAQALTAMQRINAWEKILSHPSNGDLENLKIANNFFNQLQFISDTPLKGEGDTWLTPYEMLKNGGGDCEDFAIAKFFTAQKLGINPQKLRITYVTIKKTNQAHMVLAYYETPTAEPLILDNIIKQILPGSKRQDLQPVYSFGLEDVWLFNQKQDSQRYGDAQTLSKWQSLLKRFNEQKVKRNKK